MTEKVDVCVIHSDSFLEEYAIETMLAKTGCKINLLSKKLEGSYADCMNELISKCTSEYIVIFQSNTLVEENWCEDLLFYSKNIVNSGCVGIQGALNDKLKNKPLLTIDDDLQNVWVADNNMIEGLFMFKKSLLTEEIGMFERLFDNTGFEQVVFSLKFSFSGYNNYYIRKQSIIEMDIASRNEIFPTKTKNGIMLINAFVKANIDFTHE